MESIYAFSSFSCGLALLVVGFVHLFKHVLGHHWCDHSCVGPYLFWDDDNSLDDTNRHFRETFSLMPRALGENFGVIFLALLTLRAHTNSSTEFMANFKQNAGWLLFVALFAAFPFAGGLGIIVGFTCVATAALGVVCHLTNRQGSATLDLAVGGGGSMDRLGGTCRFPEWFFRFWNLFLILVLSLTVLTNFIHIFRNEFHKWCEHHKGSDDECVGPLLIWPDDFLQSSNLHYFGSVFSLDINRGLELWTPIILVVWFLALGSESWILNAFGLVILALFGAFGYAGNMGVVVGMMLSVAACLAFLVGLLGGREAQVPNGYVRDGGLLA